MAKYEATPDDPWWVDPTNTKAVLQFAAQHVKFTIDCSHKEADFSYDFCPFTNGIVDKAIFNAQHP